MLSQSVISIYYISTKSKIMGYLYNNMACITKTLYNYYVQCYNTMQKKKKKKQIVYPKSCPNLILQLI